MAEAVLRNALVVDGTLAPGRSIDVLVRDGLIADVGIVHAAEGRNEVDLRGLVLAPGFIDPHTHYDAQVFWDRDLTPSSWHGVTTVVMGNCGFGVAPTRREHRELVLQTLERVEGMPIDALRLGLPWAFETYAEYLDAVDALPKRVHVAALVGHTRSGTTSWVTRLPNARPRPTRFVRCARSSSARSRPERLVFRPRSRRRRAVRATGARLRPVFSSDIGHWDVTDDCVPGVRPC